MLLTIVGNINDYPLKTSSFKGTQYTKYEKMSTEDEIRFLHACEHGEMDVIDSLIDSVNINCVTQYSETGLILACNSEQPWVIDVVNKLLHHGIDVDIKDDIWGDALNYVLEDERFRPQLASLLMMCSKKSLNNTKTTRLYACTVRSYAFVVENGLDINRIIEYDEGKFGTYLDSIQCFINYMKENGYDDEDTKEYTDKHRVLRSLGAKYSHEL